MIKKYPMQVPYVVSDFKDHKTLKATLMKMLRVQNSTTAKQGCENYARSDWYVDPGVMREYWKYLYPYLSKHMAKVFTELGVGTEYCYNNEWFIEYGKKGGLDWHRHQDQLWASVYYVDLPKGAAKTVLKSPFDGSIIEPDVKEGQILTFAGLVEHCSPVSDAAKTIIAFNIK